MGWLDGSSAAYLEGCDFGCLMSAMSARGEEKGECALSAGASERSIMSAIIPKSSGSSHV